MILAALCTLLALSFAVSGWLWWSGRREADKRWLEEISRVDVAPPARGKLLDIRVDNRMMSNPFTVSRRVCRICGEKFERHFAVVDGRCDRCIGEQFDTSPAGPSDWPKL